MLSLRLPVAVLVLLLWYRTSSASPNRELLGSWRWNDGSPELPVYRDVRLVADHNFEFRTAGEGFTWHGWWRIEHRFLLLNFWFDPGDAEVPCQPDLKLKIVSVDKQHFRFLRGTEEIFAQRIK
jgi:hypothetical protein